ncbi:MAG: class I SAM-dependent methyltransferase [Sneathiella sp.]
MKHYEELTGGEGRRIFYRAERFLASDVLKGDPPIIKINKQSFPLFDLSMSGLSFTSEMEDSWLDEMNVETSVSLSLGPSEIFSGHAKIRRIEPMNKYQKIALELTGGFLDIPGLMERHDELALQETLDTGMEDLSSLVPAEYKEMISDTIFLLRSAKATLEKIERDMPEGFPRREERIKEVILACEQHAFARWQQFYAIGNKVINDIRHDQKTVEATKLYTESVLMPELMAGKNWHRSYTKPLGYPGDFQIMNYFYNLSLDGQSPYEKFCHQLGNSTGEFISVRMNMVKQAIAKLAIEAADRGKKSFDVANLGCGPAQEVSNYLKSDRLPLPMNFTLIDQDHDALSCAYENAFPEVSRLKGQVKVNCLNASFMEFLAAGKLFSKLGKQDLIYTVGLVDYLSENRAGRFLSDLYANLNPGGTVIIGNMRESDESLEWVLDYVTDWKLVYRTEAEMLSMADRIEEEATREVIADSTGHCHLLIVTKPE